MSPSLTKQTHSIATIGGDGIGPEVVNAGVQVLERLAHLDGTFTLEFKDYDWSSEIYKKTGQYIPAGGLEELKKHDVILFGAVGAPGMHILCPSFHPVPDTGQCIHYIFWRNFAASCPGRPWRELYNR